MSNLSLDELFAAAKAEYAKTLKTKPVAASVPRWTRGLNVRLLHTGTNAFLGDFSEWLSSRDGARRLTREEDNTLPIHKTEWIAGDWGVNTPEPANCPRSEKRYIVELPLELEGTPLLVGRADIEVSLEAGAIISACLVSDSTFFNGDGEILEFPAAFNIYPLLTRGCKVIIFHEVRQQQEL